MRYISMNWPKIEDETPHLPEEGRPLSTHWLVTGFDSPPEKAIKSDWLLESLRRADELDNESVQPVPSDEVMRRARALIKKTIV